MRLPTNAEAVWEWTAALMGGYLAIRYAISGICRILYRKPAEINIVGAVFDAGTFAGSLLLLLGIFEPLVLHAIGEVKPYLIVAAFAGLIFTLKALRPPL